MAPTRSRNKSTTRQARTSTSCDTDRADRRSGSGLRAQLSSKDAELEALRAEITALQVSNATAIAEAQRQAEAARVEREAAERQLALANNPPANPQVHAILDGQAHTNKIPKPKGSAGKNWSLKAEMRLTNHGDEYKAIHRTVLRLVARADLDPNVAYKNQDSLLIGTICRAAQEQHPYLARFVRPAAWPVLEMIKLLLRNQRAYMKATGGSLSVSELNVTLPIQGVGTGDVGDVFGITGRDDDD